MELLSDSPAGLCKGIKGDSKDDDDADNDLLDIGGNVHEDKSVEENPDEDRADHRSENCADPAEQAGDADDYGCDDGELVAGPSDCFGRVEPCCQHESAQPGEKAHDYINAGGYGANVQPG